jgi:nitroreductase
MDVFETIRTTRAMRRLDPSRDVSDADLERMLEAATKAANGGNRQAVRWIVVRDPELRRQLGDIYRRAAAETMAALKERAAEDAFVRRNLASNLHLTEHMGEAPVLIIPCAPGPRERVGASVFPGVQNLLLAARALGLGTVLTTIHIEIEAELKGLLGVPEDVNTFALIPVGYPLGRWGEAPRRPWREVTYQDRWGERLS